jgi:hypothetical protein
MKVKRKQKWRMVQIMLKDLFELPSACLVKAICSLISVIELNFLAIQFVQSDELMKK